MKSLAAALFLSTAILPVGAAAADFPADRVIAMASGDWDKDGTADLAIIATPERDGEDNGIYVYLAKPAENRLKLALSLPNAVWGNLSMFGQEPELVALANGSFTLTTKNDAVGRDRWRQSLTIAYRNFDFIVAGYTFTSYDTLNPDGGGECDLNVLTGKGKSNGQPVAGKAQFVLLKDWQDDIGRSICGLDN